MPSYYSSHRLTTPAAVEARLVLTPSPDDQVGKHVTIGGRQYLNAATHNFLGMVGDDRVEAAAVRCLRKYGVGSCGPRAFYGTIGQ